MVMAQIVRELLRLSGAVFFGTLRELGRLLPSTPARSNAAIPPPSVRTFVMLLQLRFDVLDSKHLGPHPS